VPEREDWLGILFREPGAPDWHFLARECRHASEDLSAEAPLDHKQWWRGQLPPEMTEAEMITRMEGLVAEMARRMGGPTDRVLIRGNSVKAMQLLQAKPWFHVGSAWADA